jgi:hypothetical protein
MSRQNPAAYVAILEYVVRHSCVTRYGAMKSLGLSSGSAYHVLQQLVARGVLVRYDFGAAVVYCRPGVSQNAALEHVLSAYGIKLQRLKKTLADIVAGAKSKVIRIYPAKLAPGKPLAARLVALYIMRLLDGAVLDKTSWRSSGVRESLLIDVQKARRRLGL